MLKACASFNQYSVDGWPVRHLLNGAAKLFHVEKLQAPTPRRRTNRQSWHHPLGAAMTEAVMSRWTDEELRELIILWPKNSLSQIAQRLHRPLWAIRSKAKRLRLDGLRPHNPDFEHFDVYPPKRRPPQRKIAPPKPPRAASAD